MALRRKSPPRCDRVRVLRSHLCGTFLPETPSLDYIQLYHGNASLLAESLEIIQESANVILAALDPLIADDVNSEVLVGRNGMNHDTKAGTDGKRSFPSVISGRGKHPAGFSRPSSVALQRKSARIVCTVSTQPKEVILS
jgi:hypothetical protein